MAAYSQQAIDAAVAFWANQYKEHAYFLFLMLDSDSHKKRMQEFMRDWDTVARSFTPVGHPITPEELSWVYSQWLLTQQQLRLLQQQRQVWIGFVYPSFLDHLIEETELLQMMINRNLSPVQELRFWAHHHESELALSEKLMDPKLDLTPAVANARQLKRQFQQLESASGSDAEVQQFVLLSRAMNQQLSEALRIKISPNIPDLLLEHILREVRFADYRIGLLTQAPVLARSVQQPQPQQAFFGSSGFSVPQRQAAQAAQPPPAQVQPGPSRQAPRAPPVRARRTLSPRFF